jgi:hypothetical protein
MIKLRLTHMIYCEVELAERERERERERDDAEMQAPGVS